MSAFFQISDFADNAVHIASDLTETTCKVMIAQGDAVLGEYVETMVSADTIMFNKSEVTATVGDTVTVASGVNSGTWLVHRELSEDNYTMTFEVRKQ